MRYSPIGDLDQRRDGNKSPKSGKPTLMMKDTCVSLLHVNDTKFYQSFTSIDAFLDYSITAINKKYNTPKKQFSKFRHEVYGEYRILKFHYNSFGKSYILASVSLFHKGLGYVITYDVNESDFETYLAGFQEIITSFKIEEGSN